MNKNYVTIFVIVEEDYDISMIRKFVGDISDRNTKFVELIIIYTSDIVNSFIAELNIDLPMTIIKNYEDLPDFCYLGLGDTKYLIQNNIISEIETNNTRHFFIGRRANIIFK